VKPGSNNTHQTALGPTTEAKASNNTTTAWMVDEDSEGARTYRIGVAICLGYIIRQVDECLFLETH
jgi:hypothetical protein